VVKSLFFNVRHSQVFALFTNNIAYGKTASRVYYKQELISVIIINFRSACNCSHVQLYVICVRRHISVSMILK